MRAFICLGPLLLCALWGCPGESPTRDAQLSRVRALQTEGRLLESLDVLEALVEERPDDPETHYLYGVTSVRLGRASEGLWSLRRAREFEGWELRAGLELARAGIQAGDNAASIEAASRVLELEPDQRPALDIRAEALVRQGDYEAARVDGLRLRELAPDDGEVELLVLRSLIGLGQIDEAETLFAELEERRAEGSLELPEARYCTAQATFAAERGQPERARERFEACLEAHPSDGLLLESALSFFDARGDAERSLAILSSAIERDPSAARIRQLLARRHRAAGRPEDAERVLLEGTELEPASLAAMSWGALGVHYFELEDFAASASAWSRLMELVPEPGTDARLAYAESLALSGEHERALEVAEALPDGRQKLLQGRVLLEQRQAGPALEALDAAIRLWPDNAAARYYAARAAERLGDFERAISEYRASLRTDVEATDAGLRLGRLHLAEGRYQPARVALSHHLRGHPDAAAALALYYRLNLRLAQQSAANQTLLRLSKLPGERGRALAEAARALASGAGDAAAADLLIRESAGLEPSPSDREAALRSLVEHLGRAGRSQEALVHTQAALDAHPDAGALVGIHGQALTQAGASREARLAAYARSVELDPRYAPAWRALARLRSESGDRAGAVDAYARALDSVGAASLDAPEIAIESARLLVEMDRVPEARELLEDLLWWHPIDGRLAARLAEAPLAENPGSERALALARRAARFRHPTQGPPLGRADD